MSNQTTTPSPVRIGATVFPTDQSRNGGIVAGNPFQAYPAVEAGVYFLINSRTQDDPYFTFGLLTGRTRRMFGRFGVDCPTIERFEVETVAVPFLKDDGEWTFSLVGKPGARIPGTWAIRPENLVA